MTIQYLTARVNLGTVDLLGKVFELQWLSAGGTDTVTVDVRGLQPSRVGTVVGLEEGGSPRLVIVEPMYTYLRDQHGPEIIAAVRTACQARP